MRGNLASPSRVVRRRSIAAFNAEARRCIELGIPFLVFHPGAHMGSGEEAGLARAIDALNVIVANNGEIPALTVEITAGQGTCLGGSLDHLSEFVRRVRSPVRVCIDTCHLFVAGYPMDSEQSWERTLQELDATVGLRRLVAIHVNDSKKGPGSRVDRHDHIGKGRIGETAFRCLMNDPRLADIPKILETEKSEDMHEDVENMAALRSLVAEP